MEVNELIELRDYNELDLLFKIIEIAESNKKRAEKSVKGNDTAGKDVRHSMQDIRLLAEVIRETIQINRHNREPKFGEYKGHKISLTKLEKAIIDKKESERKEEIFIKRAENLRRKNKRENIQ